MCDYVCVCVRTCFCESYRLDCQVRFKGLRKRHVSFLAKNPKGKPRHEVVNIDLFVKKSTSKYVDFRQVSWFCITFFNRGQRDY